MSVNHSAPPYPYRWLCLVTVATALLLIVVDMTVLYTALPSLSAALHTSTSEKLWIVNAYSLIVAGLLLGMGTLGDRLGHRHLFVSGLLVFGTASLCAAFAPTSFWLILARAALGLGAAMMMPATLAIIRTVFTDERERSLAIGIWSAIAAGGAAMGPVVGGILLEYFWWGSVFLINVPIVLLALAASFFVIPTTPGNKTHPWDGYSSLLVMIGMIAAVSALKDITLPNTSWPYFWSNTLVGLVFLGWFSRRQLTQPQPLLSFAIFRNPLLSAGVLTAFLCTITLTGVEFAFTQQLQLVLNHSPFDAALILLPLPVAALAAGPVTGYLMRHISYPQLLILALAGSIAGMLCFTLLHDMGPWPRAISLVLLGASISAVMTTASYTVLEQAPAGQVGMVSSIEEISYELGGALGVAIMGSVLSALYSIHMLPATLTLNQPEAADSIDQTRLIASTLQAEHSESLLHAAALSFNQAFNTVNWLSVAVMLLALILTLLLVRQRDKP